jgi:3-oxoacyl-ACP reductase-like protein
MEKTESEPATAAAAAPAAAPAAATPAAATPEPSTFSYVLSLVTQQLLEELGRAKSSESEENAALSKELERLRLDALSMEEMLLEMQAAYVVMWARRFAL